ncbi:WecB/TagA/CpsF family glycosyltransferase [Phragmitibacter flavus]|uniref:WecB/TagA/CpsF family glycosyltransferase n=2 Tax=Phragmitibacter flavus TaxID=2576071 RepID=A0A5R8KF97_9BACT|nr:WecB/TagA/CpsF family glycosyltransferase [Phragmitibacter flavus]
MPTNIPHIKVLESPISAVNMTTACEHIFEALRNKRKGYICVTGVHGVNEAFDHADFLEVLGGAYLVTPDGMPMVWLGWLNGQKQMDRVYGPDLMLEVCRQSVEKGFTHFFYGGAPGVADLLKIKLTTLFPGLQVVGTYCPPYRALNAVELEDLQQQVTAVKPDMIWVGLGTPKQERFVASHLSLLDTTLLCGVGAAFDFHTNRVKQAPRWMQRSGLEWLYRTIQEPRRLFGRYFRGNSLFLWRLFLGLKPKHLSTSTSTTSPTPNPIHHEQ